MNIVNKNLSLSEFEDFVKSFNFSPLNPNKLVIHHTWKPTIEQWQGQKSINGLKAFYERKGWNAAPHLFIAEDGIWLFTPMNQTGIHAGEGNYKSIGIEVVGDYNNKVWEGKTKENVLGSIKALQSRVGDTIMFHRDYSPKSCPGNALSKEWLSQNLAKEEISKEKQEYFEMEFTRKQIAAEESVEAWNAIRKEWAEAKGVPVYHYKIVDDKDL